MWEIHHCWHLCPLQLFLCRFDLTHHQICQNVVQNYHLFLTPFAFFEALIHLCETNGPIFPWIMYWAQIFYLFLRDVQGRSSRSMTLHPWTWLRIKWNRILCTWCRSFTRHEKSLKRLHIALQTTHMGFKQHTCSGRGPSIWDSIRVKGEYESSGEYCSRCVVSESSVQKTSSLAHRLTTPFRVCRLESQTPELVPIWIASPQCILGQKINSRYRKK